MGMGIGDFLKHAAERGGSGDWLQSWRDEKKITVWLHRTADIGSSWSHRFMYLDQSEDKEHPGRVKRFLRFPRFISPDHNVVNENQFFRDRDTGKLKVPPSRDPFLLLREWLVNAEHLDKDQVIFRWEDPNTKARVRLHEWTRTELARLEKRNQSNFDHSLDSKLEYIFVVVQNDRPDDGPKLTRESQLLGKCVRKAIAVRMEKFGEEAGDPCKHPCAFVWTFDPKSSSPMDSYGAYVHEGIQLTPEIDAQISSAEPPDSSAFCQPADGDMAKIRAAMEQHAQVDLPLDDIFSEDEGVRMEAIGYGRRRPGSSPRPAPTQTRAAAAPAPAKEEQAPAAPAAAGAGGVMRRRKAEPPKVPMIACDECQTLIEVTCEKCPKCGTEYEVDAGPAQQIPAQPAKAPAASPQKVAEPQAVASSGAKVKKCLACESEKFDEKGACAECGLDDAGDDLPFD